MGIIIKGPIANATYEAPRPDNGGASSWDRARDLLSPEVIGDLSRVSASLRWLLSNPDVHTAIVGTTNIRHLEANIESAESGPLPDDVLATITQRIGSSGPESGG
jgi:aryl-alcohol dehydrogenase-like predicted oxidoreductase